MRNSFSIFNIPPELLPLLRADFCARSECTKRICLRAVQPGVQEFPNCDILLRVLFLRYLLRHSGL